jgi:diguanylate cyclase (GGDEF)-like protein
MLYGHLNPEAVRPGSRSHQLSSLPVRLRPLQSRGSAADSWLLLELLEPLVTLAEMDQISQGYQQAGYGLFMIEVLQMDLIRGKLGVTAAEALVEDLLRRLVEALPSPVFLARQGGDRLVVIVPGMLSVDEARIRGEEMMLLLETPITMAEHVLELSVSMGVSRTHEDGNDFHQLLLVAGRALDHTHRYPFSNCCVALPEERQVLLCNLLANPLANAIEQDRLELAYQPIVELTSGSIAAVEVLCRWHDPELGQQSPEDFIDVARATKQMARLEQRVIKRALSQLARWDRSGLTVERLSINISPLRLREPEWIGELQRLLDQHGLTPGRIILEIAENNLLDLAGVGEIQFRDLRRLGFGLAMDDFGSGYAGLRRLSELPFTSVKIDRSLIAAIDYDQMQQSMINSLIDYATNDDLEVVVEGIERARQLQMLITLGCRHGQGYHLAPPQSPAQIETLLRSGSLLP